MESDPNVGAVLFTIGSYHVIKSLGQGGMGEVFLAYDSRCRRNVALKRIRPDLAADANIRSRFLYEAHLTGLMSHPSIVPIYDIVNETDSTYYTMPYLEGITLDALVALGQQQEIDGRPTDIRTTLPVLLHAFLSVCHAVSYAHSKGVIHRDLKPANIIICPNGEAVILDWGLAKIIKDQVRNTEGEASSERKTVEKVTGTIGYVAPEQAFGQHADYSTEIYGLGVILYEILALRHPFHRHSLEQYRQNLSSEVLLDPAKVAPQRGITPILSMIALKCLSSIPQERYQSIDELLFDLENYLKKHSDWFKTEDFDGQPSFEWKASAESLLMKTFSKTTGKRDLFLISRRSFGDLVKITLKVKLSTQSSGIGFLLGIPGPETDLNCQQGYCLWLASEETKTTTLFCLPDKEIQIDGLFLAKEEWYEIQIEKLDTTLSVYLNQKLQFTYVMALPTQGTHIGICLPENETAVRDGQIFIGGYSFCPNPLAAANAFLATGYWGQALEEYREVARKQPHTLEGRKAQFRAGIALLEYQKADGGDHSLNFDACLQEFQKLSHPISAPLALLGQAWVCQYSGDYSEEVHCFEIAFTRYAHHSLIYLWHNQLLSRLLESTNFDRRTLFRFLLLAMRFLPEELITPHVHRLLSTLKEMTDPLYFLNDRQATHWPVALWRLSKSIRLAFWLADVEALTGLIDDQLKSLEQHLYSIANALCALLELGAYQLVEQKLEVIYEIMLDVQAMATFDWIHELVLIHRRKEATLSQNLLSNLPHSLNKQSMRIIVHILYEALRCERTDLFYENVDVIEKKFILSNEGQKMMTCCRIWALLLDKKWDEAEKLLLSQKDLNQNELKPLFPSFLRGCWLAAVQGSAVASVYFSAENPAGLGRLFESFIKDGQFLQSKEFSQAFMWEKRNFFQQMALYYHCLGGKEAARNFKNLEMREYV